MKRPALLAVALRLSWPIREGYTLRIDGLVRELALDWDVTLVSLCGDPTESTLPPAVNFVPVDKASDGFTATPAELDALRSAVVALAERTRPQAILIWTGASYIATQLAGTNMVVDLIDSDALVQWRELWHRRPAREYVGLLRHAVRIARLERALGQHAYAVVVVGDDDARVMRRLAGRSSVHVIPNGVSVDGRPGLDRYAVPTVAFTGVLGYPPNVAAVLYFARRVWPHVRRALPDATFIVAGRDPSPEITQLSRIPGIDVLGAVPDMSAILERSWIAVAPMRSGAGIKNKVLEAWAVGTPAVMTPMAANGLGSSPTIDALVRRSPRAMAELVIELLTDADRRRDLGTAVLDLARERTWAAVARPLSNLLLQASLQR